MTRITVAALQLAFTEDREENIAHVAELVREAAGKGAQVVLPPELFEGPYFCRVEDEDEFATARTTAEHPSVRAMQSLAAGAEDLDPDKLFRTRRPASL
jgi:N-carbamoylputrescine amidase